LGSIASDPIYRRRLLPGLILLLAVLKLGLGLALGPGLFEDSVGYLHLRDLILTDPTWWSDGQWSNTVMPDRLFRPYGFPLLLVAMRALAGDGGLVLLLVLQSLVSLGLLFLFGLFLERLIPGMRLRLLLVALCGLSQEMLFDLSVLSDSFYASLFVGAMLLLGAQLTGALRPRLGLSLLLGLLWAASASLRDVALMHALLPFLGLLLLIWRRRLGWGGGLLHLLAFALPLLLLFLGIEQWNLLRTGHRFFSLTGGINWLWPGVNIRDRGLADPFTCLDLFCEAARGLPDAKGMAAVFGIANGVESQLQLDPIAFGQLSFRHFLGVVSSHPFAFIASIFGNMHLDKLAEAVFNPLFNLNELFQLHSGYGKRLIEGLREYWQAVRHGHMSALPMLLLSLLLEIASLAAMVLAVFGAPYAAVRALRRGEATETAWTALYFWLMAAMFIGSYSLIHMELRHAMPAIPLILALFGYGLSLVGRGQRQG